jgi:Platelet-activating factor acetylhydrolase, isoform II
LVRGARFWRATAAGLGTVALAVAVGLPVALPVFALPRPGGPFAIGTVTYHWMDTARQEIFSPDASARHEVMVQVWYPAAAGASAPREPYVRDADTLSPELARLARLPGFAFDHFRYVSTDAVPGAPVATAAAAYPVLIFLEGLNGFRQMNTAQVEALVSHGYVVAAVDQPYAAASVRFPDGHHVTGLQKARMEPFTAQSLAPSRRRRCSRAAPSRRARSPTSPRTCPSRSTGSPRSTGTIRTRCSPGGWTCAAPGRSGCRSGPSSPVRRAGPTPA